jgi:hydroxyacylglutathione hydrolase
MAVIVNNSQIRIDRFELGPYGTNAYILICPKTGESVLVDAPAEADRIIGRLRSTTPKYILLTHNHMDHVGALARLRSRLKIPLAAHALDSESLPRPADILLNDGDTVSFGSIKLKVLHTPGHTPGSLCFRFARYLISGDTIFPGGPGNTASPDAFDQIIRSIAEKILVLHDDTRIYPGHGNATLLKKEKADFAVFSSRTHSPRLFGDVLWLSS